MKSFTLSATNLNDVATVIDKLTPQDIVRSIPDINPIEANRVVERIVKHINEANVAFVDEIKNTFEKKSAIIEKYQKEYADKHDELDEAGQAKLGTELTGKMTRETNEVQAASKAHELAKLEISVSLSDEDYAVLKDKLLPSTVNFWVGPQGESLRSLFLSVIDAMDKSVSA